MAYLNNLFKQICFTSTMLQKEEMHVDGEGKIHDSKKWNFEIFMTKVVSTTKTTLQIDCSLKQILEQPHLKDS